MHFVSPSILQVKKQSSVTTNRAVFELRINKDEEAHHRKTFAIFVLKSTHKIYFPFIYSQDSVYVLDDANLAQNGIEYWEHNKQHSRVNSEWWINQLRIRDLQKIKFSKEDALAVNILEQDNSSILNTPTNYEPFPFDLDEDGMSVVSAKESSVRIHEQSDDEQIDTNSSVIGIAPNGFQKEFQSLMDDYQSVSQKLLDLEKEKNLQTQKVCAHEKTLLEKNLKIEEMGKQINLNEQNLKSSQKCIQEKDERIEHLQEKQQQMIENLERDLSTNLERKLSLNITREINETLKNTNINSMIGNEEIKENSSTDLTLNVLLKEMQMLREQNHQIQQNFKQVFLFCSN